MTALQVFGTLGLIALALAAVAYFARAYPTRSMVWVGLVPGLSSIILLVWPTGWWPLVALDAALLIVVGIDLPSLPRGRSLSIQRRMGRIASLGKPHEVQLTLVNHAGRAQRIVLRDALPVHLEADQESFTIELPARSRATLHYRVRPMRRGAYAIETTNVRLTSRLGLWQRQAAIPSPGTIHVYPDMKQMSEYAVLARTNRLSLMGVRRTRRIGEDNEFERLRDYERDDNFRHIDWRTTARRRKLTVRQFQRNQSQRIFFLIDCGRMMTNEAAGLSLLDHSLNAMLMLSFVALSHGDSVGLLCFSDEVHSYVPPRGGRSQTNRLLHASFDRFAHRVESRYDKAFLYLNHRCRQRSLVVLITNVIDEVNREQVQRYLTGLAGQHLPLGVLLRDRRVFDFADAPRPTGESLYTAAAAAEILNWRAEVLAQLTSRGVLVVDTFAEELTAPLVNRYLEIKARHLL